jgi:hypothetical protein
VKLLSTLCETTPEMHALPRADVCMCAHEQHGRTSMSTQKKREKEKEREIKKREKGCVVGFNQNEFTSRTIE